MASRRRARRFLPVRHIPGSDQGFPPVPQLIARPIDPEDQPSEATEHVLRRRWVGASALLHVALVMALIGLVRPSALPDDVVIKVALVDEGAGAAGAAGGNGGGGGDARAPTTATAAETGEAPTQPSNLSPVPAAPETARPAPEDAPKAVAEPSTPPRHKPKPPRPTVAETSPAAAPIAPQPAETTRFAAAPTTVPTPGAPGAGNGPGGAGGIGAGAQGAGRGAVGDGPINGPGDDYLNRLRRHLKQFQTYPEDAKNQKQEGVVLLDITIASDGTVLGVAVARSSGFPLLDDAAIKMAHDASPVPPFPPNYPQTHGTTTIPASYTLGFFQRIF